MFIKNWLVVFLVFILKISIVCCLDNAGKANLSWDLFLKVGKFGFSYDSELKDVLNLLMYVVVHISVTSI